MVNITVMMTDFLGDYVGNHVNHVGNLNPDDHRDDDFDDAGTHAKLPTVSGASLTGAASSASLTHDMS